MTEVSTGPPGGRWTPSEKGTTMDTIDRSLALTSLREPAPDRIRPRGSAAPTRLGALVAAGGAALATIEASAARLGPGRYVLLAVAVAWAVGALGDQHRAAR